MGIKRARVTGEEVDYLDPHRHHHHNLRAGLVARVKTGAARRARRTGKVDTRRELRELGQR